MLKIRLISLSILIFVSSYLLADNNTFCKIVENASCGRLSEALCQLESYRCEYGEDCIFEALLIYIADCIDQDSLCTIIEEGNGPSWAELFLELAKKKTKESIALQQKSELLARMLITNSPCNAEYFTLYNKAARTFEKVPPLDYIALRRSYGNLLLLNPCDCEALASMAYAAFKAGWIDYSSALYHDYFDHYQGGADEFLNYSKALQDQYNITYALYLNELYGQCVGYDTTYWQNRAYILNYGSLAEAAYPILIQLVEEEPNHCKHWGVYAQTAATINHRYESLYALNKAECLCPSDIETHWAEWLVLPPVMSRFTGYGSYYHESTTLANVIEGGNFYGAIDPYTKYVFGFEGFQTSARPKIITDRGIGRLVGPDGQETAEVETGWAGIEKLFHPKLLVNLRLGAARSFVDVVNNQWTPIYLLDIDSRNSDYLNIHFFSTYNFYQFSPRASSFNIRRWRNQLDIDWRPNYDTQFLTTIDGRCLTDGNKQLEIYFYPRRNILYLEHWKITTGLMGNWLTTRNDPIHGYYAPHLYQVYAAQALIEYRVNRHSSIKTACAGGTQKDNFSSSFGSFAQITLDCLLEFSLNWRLRLFGDYYYIHQSDGSFNYIKYLGEITYRF